MADHLRFKRYLRFLREGDLVRVVTDLDDGIALPAGTTFDHLLAAMTDAPDRHALRSALACRLQLDTPLVDVLLEQLFALRLIEHFDPAATDLDRFDRQMLLFDALDPVAHHRENITRQQRLADAHVLVLGLGGIGHQAALSLAAAGIGTLVLVDHDRVEESNLHRQVLFSAEDLGRSKVEAARSGILRVAPRCNVVCQDRHIRHAADWRALILRYPHVRHVVLSADTPVDLVDLLSDARIPFGYHFIKCGYMSTQGLIGPLLGPDTPGHADLFRSLAPLIDDQCEGIRAFNARGHAPTMAASNAIMANIATFELIKHITGTGTCNLLGKRLLLDLHTYLTTYG